MIPATTSNIQSLCRLVQCFGAKDSKEPIHAPTCLEIPNSAGVRRAKSLHCTNDSPTRTRAAGLFILCCRVYNVTIISSPGPDPHRLRCVRKSPVEIFLVLRRSNVSFHTGIESITMCHTLWNLDLQLHIHAVQELAISEWSSALENLAY